MYSPERVAKELGIANSTLRKYAETFEEAGYQIKRNEMNIRRYNDEDIQILKSFTALKQRNSKRTNKEIIRDFLKFDNNLPKQKQQIIDVNKLLINYIKEMQVTKEKYDEAIKLINLRLNHIEDL